VVPKYVGTSYVPTLAASTTYYWKIVAFNDGGSAIGPVWSFTTPAATAVLFNMAGAIVTTRARFGTLRIHDVLGPQPNTAGLLFDTIAPTGGESIQIGLGTLDDDDLIFGGEVQAVDESYVGTPDLSAFYDVSLIDHTFRINKRRPFGTWTNVSATTIAQYLVATFAPSFTSTHVQPNLPAVSVNFDGSQDFMACMKALADAISDDTTAGKTKVDYARDVHLFLTEDSDAPDPLDVDHPPLNDPSPITFSVDHSQIRTRVYGKGHGENVPTDVAAGETILPIADAVMFSATGGRAIAGTVAGGAQTQQLTYTGVQLGGGGSLVGPGAAPSVAPSAAVANGTGLSVGAYQYAYSDVTASGESLPSPLATLSVGTLAAPTTSPAAGTPTSGSGVVDAGAHTYAVTFVNAAGETTPSPISSQVTTVAGTAAASNPSTQPNASSTFRGESTPLQQGATYSYKYTFKRISDGAETLPSAASTGSSIPNPANPGLLVSLSASFAQTPPSGYVRQWYRTQPNGATYFRIGAEVSTDIGGGSFVYFDYTPDASLGAAAPSSNGTAIAALQTVPLTAIPLGDANVTSRKLYRDSAGAGLKLVTTIADNVTTTYSDTSANASLGAIAPVTNTAAANRVNLSAIATGATAVTARNLYRTAAGGTQLKRLATLADNTTTTYADSVADSSLGVNAPSGDTSGLTQPSGQVNAGATSILTSSGSPFPISGGWVTLSGGQTVRYTGVSANTLTGVPASGAGSITTTVIYGSQILPAPSLTGINASNGLTVAMAKGSAVHIWVQRDDLDAQAALAILELDENGVPTDGIREYAISDGARQRRCDHRQVRCGVSHLQSADCRGELLHARYEDEERPYGVDQPTPRLLRSGLLRPGVLQHECRVW
jgi:hypothetical protein